MAVVVQHQRADPALRIALNRNPRQTASIWVEKDRIGLRGQLGNFAIVILLVEQISLAKERDNNQASFIDVFAREAVKLARCQFQGRRVQRDGDALGKWRWLWCFSPMQ
jgi:hypothetical protein